MASQTSRPRPVTRSPSQLDADGAAQCTGRLGRLPHGPGQCAPSDGGVVTQAAGASLGALRALAGMDRAGRRSPPPTPARQSTANWNTSLLDGPYDVRVVYTDGAVHVFSGHRRHCHRQHRPTVTIGGVAAGQAVSGTLTLSATAADAVARASSSVQFGRRTYPAGGAYTNIGSALTTEPFDAAFATTGAPDGRYEIQALATDVAGNTHGDSVIDVLVDNTLPSTPAKPTGLSPVVGRADDHVRARERPGAFASGIDHYDVYRNSGLTPINAAPIPRAARTPGASGRRLHEPGRDSGTYTYTVVAVDVAGNQSAFSGGLTILLDPLALSAPTSVTRARDPDQPASAGLLGRARHAGLHPRPLPGVPRRRVRAERARPRRFTDNIGGLRGQHLHLPGGRRGLRRRSPAFASAPVTVVYDTRAPAAPGGVTPPRRSTARSASAGRPRATAPARASRATSCGASLSSTRAGVSAADGDATCQGPTTSCATRPRSTASSTATRCSPSTRRQHVPGRQSAGRDGARPARARGAHRVSSATPGDAQRRPAVGRCRAPTTTWPATCSSPSRAAQAPASETDGTRVCTGDRGRRRPRASATGLTNGATYTFGLFALDEALNRSQPAVVSAAPNGKVTDVKAPAAVSKLQGEGLRAQGHADLEEPGRPRLRPRRDHRRPSASPPRSRPSKRVYSGKGTKATTTLAAGQSRWFIVVAYDAVGNASAPASVHVTIAAASKFGPAPRAKVHGKVQAELAGRQGREVLQRAGLRRQEADPRQLAGRPRAAAAARPSSSAARSTPGTSGRASARRPRRTTAS